MPPDAAHLRLTSSGQSPCNYYEGLFSTKVEHGGNVGASGSTNHFVKTVHGGQKSA